MKSTMKETLKSVDKLRTELNEANDSKLVLENMAKIAENRSLRINKYGLFVK